MGLGIAVPTQRPAKRTKSDFYPAITSCRRWHYHLGGHLLDAAERLAGAFFVLDEGEADLVVAVVPQPAHTTVEFKIATTEETPLLVMPVFGGGQFQAHETANVRITATVADKDDNTLGDLEPISLIAVAAWEAEFVKAGLKIVPPPERQKEYARLSGQLLTIGLRRRAELPS